MSKAKVVKQSEVPKILAKSPFSGFSRFGGKPLGTIQPRFNQKAFNSRPTFVTQHKGGGGK